jgi:rhodanese-related sulfurtransferase
MTALGTLGWEDVLSLKGGSYGGWVEAGFPTVEGLPPEPVALNVANPNPYLLSVMDGVLTNVPDGFGVITVDDLNQEIIENADLILIDVRRAEEVEEKGEIEGAIQIPLESFIELKDQWPQDPEAPIVIYCGSGHRSTMAMTIMWAYGFDDVRSLKDGFSAWEEAGYPVVEAVAP